MEELYKGARRIEDVLAPTAKADCFVCSKANPTGWHLEYWADDAKGEIFTVLDMSKKHSGFKTLLHGGVTSTLFDEVAFWAMFDKFHLFGFTLSMNVRYITPIRLAERWVQARAKVAKVEGRKVTVHVWLINCKNERCAEGELVFLQPKMASVQQILGKELAQSLDPFVHRHSRSGYDGEARVNHNSQTHVQSAL